MIFYYFLFSVFYVVYCGLRLTGCCSLDHQHRTDDYCMSQDDLIITRVGYILVFNTNVHFKCTSAYATWYPH